MVIVMAHARFWCDAIAGHKRFKTHTMLRVYRQPPARRPAGMCCGGNGRWFTTSAATRASRVQWPVVSHPARICTGTGPPAQPLLAWLLQQAAAASRSRQHDGTRLAPLLLLLLLLKLLHTQDACARRCGGPRKLPIKTSHQPRATQQL
jgi:hypothetical protein